MYQLIYISTARPNGLEADVEGVLSLSRRNNSRDGLTGLLVYDGVRFLQALEGDREHVVAAYARIKADTRHRASVTLSEREVSAREFGSWEMACERIGATPTGKDLATTVNAMVASLLDRNVQALFSGFARLDRRVA